MLLVQSSPLALTFDLLNGLSCSRILNDFLRRFGDCSELSKTWMLGWINYSLTVDNSWFSWLASWRSRQTLLSLKVSWFKLGAPLILTSLILLPTRHLPLWLWPSIGNSFLLVLMRPRIWVTTFNAALIYLSHRRRAVEYSAAIFFAVWTILSLVNLTVCNAVVHMRLPLVGSLEVKVVLNSGLFSHWWCGRTQKIPLAVIHVDHLIWLDFVIMIKVNLLLAPLNLYLIFNP